MGKGLCMELAGTKAVVFYVFFNGNQQARGFGLFFDHDAAAVLGLNSQCVFTSRF